MITGKLFLTIKNSPLASQLELAPLKSNDLLILIFIDTDDLAVHCNGPFAATNGPLQWRREASAYNPRRTSCAASLHHHR